MGWAIEWRGKELKEAFYMCDNRILCESAFHMKTRSSFHEYIGSFDFSFSLPLIEGGVGWW